MSDSPVALNLEVSPLVEAVAFWTAILTPVFYIPLLFTGLEGREQQYLFVALVALNVVAILLGHSHHHE